MYVNPAVLLCISRLFYNAFFSNITCCSEEHHKVTAEIQLRLLSYPKYQSIERIKASAGKKKKIPCKVSVNFDKGSPTAERVVASVKFQN